MESRVETISTSKRRGFVCVNIYICEMALVCVFELKSVKRKTGSRFTVVCIPTQPNRYIGRERNVATYELYSSCTLVFSLHFLQVIQLQAQMFWPKVNDALAHICIFLFSTGFGFAFFSFILELKLLTRINATHTFPLQFNPLNSHRATITNEMQREERGLFKRDFGPYIFS